MAPTKVYPCPKCGRCRKESSWLTERPTLDAGECVFVGFRETDYEELKS